MAADVEDALLVRHYRQLRTTQGTVLLGPARYDARTELDPAWFIDGCPLDPASVVSVLARRHDLGDAAKALARLQELRSRLQGAGDPGAMDLLDLPSGGPR